MPSFNQIKDTVTTCLAFDPTSVFYITGVPGGGKSDCAYSIALDGLNTPRNRVARIHAANHDVVDMTGVPTIEDGMTVFAATKMLAQFREGTGAGVIIIEEAAQAQDDMQCFLAGLTLDRETTEYKLDPQVSIIMTGNRVEDKAGARPLLTQFNDRIFEINMEVSLSDWCDHAASIGVDFRGIAFLRLRPDLLNEFTPDRKCATQRGWTQLFTKIPMDSLPTDMYLEVARGRIGEGAAGEWVAAKDMMAKMPNIDVVRMHPEKAEIPDEPSIKYAISTALAMTATEASFDRDMAYMNRFPVEFTTAFVSDALSRNPELQMTQAFVAYAMANQDIYMNNN